MIFAGCGYELRSAAVVPTEIKIMTLSSAVSAGSLIPLIRRELFLNGITVVDTDKSKSLALPLLRVVNVVEKRLTVSVLQDGKIAEFKIILAVAVQLLIPGRECYTIDVKVYRVFFNNQLIALAKDAEEDMFRREMYLQAAQKVLRKLLLVNFSKKPEIMLNTQLQQQQQKNSGRVSQ